MLVGMQTAQPLGKTDWCFLSKLSIPCNPAIMGLGVYPKELETSAHTKTCKWIFISTLFIIAITWKQLRFPTIGEFPQTVVHAGNGILFRAKKEMRYQAMEKHAGTLN